MYDEQIIIYDLEDENGDFFQKRRKGRGRSLALMEQMAESQKEEDNTNMDMNGWVSVGAGLFPEDKKTVQVTYIGYYDGKPYCDAFAYRLNGEWKWFDDDTNINVEVTAWRYNCMPYHTGNNEE